MKVIVFISTLLLLNLACKENNDPTDKEQVKSTLIQLVNGIDTKEWNKTLNVLADKVTIDYSSLTGQPETIIEPKTIVGNWKKILNGVSTHHVLSNFDIVINGDEAEVFSHVYASHWAKLDNLNFWDAIGRYHQKLRKTNKGWKVIYMRLIMHGQKGNKNLLIEANKVN